ncbi:MAG: alpha/beta fold hydrolase [Pseudomonadota bacterium]|nr:alpha/beta fold hydrolase [Pseudomonadota bacterium]
MEGPGRADRERDATALIPVAVAPRLRALPMPPSDRPPLYFREVGVGPVLVFVHGIGVSSRYFVPLMQELAGSFRCVAPDLPGYGHSPGPKLALDVPGLADALAAFLDVLGIPPANVTLVANSLGCQVIAALAERDPERTAPLVLIAPTLDPATRDHFWRSVLRASIREPLSLLPILLVDYLRFGLRRFIATSRHALADDIALRLPKIRVPVLVIEGGRDRIVTVPWATHLARLLPRGQFALVADAAHAVHYSRPAVVAGLIRTFLGG